MRCRELRSSLIRLAPVCGMIRSSNSGNGVGRTRASENGIFTVGCSHQNDAVPFAYAYAPDGGCLTQTRDANRMVTVTLDLSLCFGMFLEHRQPHLYAKLIEGGKKD